MNWQKKLTKVELQHVRDWCGGTLKSFKRTRERQKRIRAKNDANGCPPGIAEPCWDCKRIAKKLGLEK